jgi:hypothetical protein
MLSVYLSQLITKYGDLYDEVKYLHIVDNFILYKNIELFNFLHLKDSLSELNIYINLQ